jgi:hypothetical protein
MVVFVWPKQVLTRVPPGRGLPQKNKKNLQFIGRIIDFRRKFNYFNCIMCARKSKKPRAGAKKAGRKAKDRKELTPFHNAAFDVFCHRLRKYQESGDVTLTDECQLSRGPLKIDVVIIKKNSNVVLELSWAIFFRKHNIIEYKSPVDGLPTVAVFDKLIGYARIYASQNDVKITDVTATLICAKEPVALFEALETEYGYEILRKGDGIYYIMRKGVDVEKDLAIQIVVEEGELMLAALDEKMAADVGTKEKVTEFILTEGLEYEERLSHWFKALPSEHLDNVMERVDNMDKKRKEAWANLMERTGLADYIAERSMLKGVQKGRQEQLRQDIISMHQEGLGVEAIARVSTLSENEVKAILGM